MTLGKLSKRSASLRSTPLALIFMLKFYYSFCCLKMVKGGFPRPLRRLLVDKKKMLLIIKTD